MMTESHEDTAVSDGNDFTAQWMSQTATSHRNVARALSEDTASRVAYLERRIDESDAGHAHPRLFIHPLILVPNAVGNQWLYRPVEVIIAGVGTMLLQIDFSDLKKVGPGVRRFVPGVLHAIDDALVVLDYLDGIDSRDPTSGADPVEPARVYIRSAIRGALAFLRACWESSDVPRGQIMESLEALAEPPWDDVRQQMEMVEHFPHSDEKVMAVGSGSQVFGSPGGRNVWDISVTDIHEIGKGYADYAKVDSSDWYALGYQAIRVCLGSPDPLLANFSALRTIGLVRHAGRINPESVRSAGLSFWSVSAPKVTDRGFTEGRAFADWKKDGDPRKLLEAHGSLLEAVGRPLMAFALALRAIIQGGPTIDADKPPLVTELLERLAAVDSEPLFDLVVRAANGNIRNAHGHEGVTRRPGNIVEAEDGAGNVQQVDLAKLEFDHEMLRSLLVGVDVGASFFQALVEGPAGAWDLPRVRHTVSSLETAIRASFHSLMPGILLGLAWADDGQTLTLRLRHGVSLNEANLEIMRVVATSELDTLPALFRFEEVARNVTRKADRRRRKAGGRRRRRRR